MCVDATSLMARRWRWRGGKLLLLRGGGGPGVAPSVVPALKREVPTRRGPCLPHPPQSATCRGRRGIGSGRSPASVLHERPYGRRQAQFLFDVSPRLAVTSYLVRSSTDIPFSISSMIFAGTESQICVFVPRPRSERPYPASNLASKT